MPRRVGDCIQRLTRLERTKVQQAGAARCRAATILAQPSLQVNRINTDHKDTIVVQTDLPDDSAL